MVDIHDKLCLAAPAPEDQVFRVGLRVGLLVRELLAVRTDITSVLYAQFNMSIGSLQSPNPPFAACVYEKTLDFKIDARVRATDSKVKICSSV